MFCLLQPSDEHIFWYSRICRGHCRNLKKKETGRLKWLHVHVYKGQLKWKGSGGQYFPLDAVMLDNRPMTGQVSPLLILMLVGKRVLVCWPNWYIVFGIVHAAVFCTCSYMPQTEAWKSVRTCSPWEITLLRSDEYGRSMGVLVYFGHMDARTRKCILHSVRSIRVRADVQAWKHPHDQSAGLYGASKRPVRFRTRSIDRYARLSRVFYSQWETLTFGHGLSPTVPKLCKSLCGLARQT